MDPKQLVMLSFQVSILCTVFGFGLSAKPEDLLYLVRRPGLAVRSLLAVLVIMPILAVVLIRIVDFQPVAEIALVALALSPVPPLLPKKEAKGGGQQSYGLALMVMLALLAIGTIPLSVEILERVSGRNLGVAPGAIARVVLTAAILPLAAGMVVRVMLPVLAQKVEGPVALVAKVLLPLAVLALLAGIWRVVWAAAGQGPVLAMAVFVAVGLLVGHLMGGPDPEHSVVLALSSASRHPAIALSIASTNFPDERFVGTILLYLIVSGIIGLPYLVWRRRQMTTAATDV